MARYVLVDDDAHTVVDPDLDVAKFARVNNLGEAR